MFLKAIWITIFLASALIPNQTSDVEQISKAASITIAELRDHMFFLASDFLGGRVTDTEGYRIAAEYCASQLRAAGVEPVARDSEGRLTYLQNVPMRKRYYLEDAEFLVRTQQGDSEFGHETSFKMQMMSDVPVIGKSPECVFVGYGIEEPEHGWDDFEGIDVTGKAVIVLDGVPTRDGEPVLPRDKHDFYGSHPGKQKRLMDLIGKRPAAVIVAIEPEAEDSWERIPSFMTRSEFFLPGIDDTGDKKSRGLPDLFIIKWDVVEALFAGQEYNPAGKDRVDLEGYKSFELKDVSYGIDCREVEEDAPSWNVVGVVRGSDPELADQYVSIGAHLDHVPPRRGQVCNGADDNASGSIGVLEIAEAVAMSPPRRSVIFILYAAEEVNPIGLCGSRYFVNACPVPIENVVANLNLDMIGRTGSASKENRSHYIIGHEGFDDPLLDIIEEVNTHTVNWPLTRKDVSAFGGASDHVSYHDKGIQAVFFFSGEHEDLHRPTDDAEKIEWDKFQKISQLVYEVATELANSDEPLLSK